MSLRLGDKYGGRDNRIPLTFRDLKVGDVFRNASGYGFACYIKTDNDSSVQLTSGGRGFIRDVHNDAREVIRIVGRIVVDSEEQWKDQITPKYEQDPQPRSDPPPMADDDIPF